jgi:hypothetical protein
MQIEPALIRWPRSAPWPGAPPSAATALAAGWPAIPRTAQASRSPADARSRRRGGSPRFADRRARPRSCGESTSACWCVHRAAIRSAALHFRASTNLEQAKSMTYLTSDRSNCRRWVKRWRDARMALRWIGTAMLEVEKSFRRLKAHKQLPILRAALLRHQQALLEAHCQ